MQIQISWHLQKPTDLDLHCLQRQDTSGSAGQGLALRVRHKWYIRPVRGGTPTWEAITPWFCLDFDGILPIVCGHLTREVTITWLLVMRQSHGNRELFKTLQKKKKKKKKISRDQCLLCAIQKEKGGILRFYCCSYFFLTGNDLGVLGVFSRKLW